MRLTRRRRGPAATPWPRYGRRRPSIAAREGTRPARRTPSVSGRPAPPKAGSSWSHRPRRRRLNGLRNEAAESALPGVKVRDRGRQVIGGERGPHDVAEQELGVRAFPEEEIAQPPLSAGADEQIDVGRRGAGAVRGA